VDEDKTKGPFYLTGSQSLKLMKNVSESLAGRAGIIKMLGLSVRELAKSAYREPFLPTVEQMSANDNIDIDYSTLVSYIHKGFFPELHETESDLKDRADYHSSYFQTYIEKDIKDVLNIQDESAFIKFVKACASLTSEMLNMSTLAEICGKDAKTVRAWLSVPESSGLVYLLEPYHNNFNKRMIKPPIYYYRDADKNEIDLIIENGDYLHPVEIKTTSDPKKSMVSAFRHLDNIPTKKVGTGAVVCLAKDQLPLTDNVWILPARMV